MPARSCRARLARCQRPRQGTVPRHQLCLAARDADRKRTVRARGRCLSGRTRPRYGKFEHGRGGTILLDEIGSMPFDLQAKFLRVLQERTITRLGSNETVPLDVRSSQQARWTWKAKWRLPLPGDLFYRLNVVTLGFRLWPSGGPISRCSSCIWCAKPAPAMAGRHGSRAGDPLRDRRARLAG